MKDEENRDEGRGMRDEGKRARKSKDEGGRMKDEARQVLGAATQKQDSVRANPDRASLLFTTSRSTTEDRVSWVSHSLDRLTALGCSVSCQLRWNVDRE
jgi:hypothetical protein